MHHHFRTTLCSLLLVASAILLGTGPSLAQSADDATVTSPGPDDKPKKPESPTGQADDNSTEPRVLCAYNPDAEKKLTERVMVSADGCPTSPSYQTVHLGSRLSVRVDGIAPFLAEKAKTSDDLRLFLDGVELTDLEKEAIQMPTSKGGKTVTELRFELLRTPENKDNWRTLLGPFTLRAHKTTVGVGLAGGAEIPGSSSVEIDLKPVQTGWLVFYLVLLVVVLLVFFGGRLPGGGRLTDSLRDRQAAVPDGGEKPYSLARCQMAWWFFLVIAAYAFLWLVLNDLDTITGSILTLMGIGSGTALGATMIDASKMNELESAKAELGAEEKVKDLRKALKKSHTTVLRDLLSDENGYSFHRFQIAVWTLVLGLIFVISVVKELAMPQFSDTLLGLMGISSGTYLGFKLPEKHK